MYIVKFRMAPALSPYVVASTFTAYLLGAFAPLNTGSLFRGPYRLKDDDSEWQLVESKDYWLLVDKKFGMGTLQCRYKTQAPVVDAMVALYKARYNVR